MGNNAAGINYEKPDDLDEMRIKHLNSTRNMIGRLPVGSRIDLHTEIVTDVTDELADPTLREVVSKAVARAYQLSYEEVRRDADHVDSSSEAWLPMSTESHIAADESAVPVPVQPDPLVDRVIDRQIDQDVASQYRLSAPAPEYLRY